MTIPLLSEWFNSVLDWMIDLGQAIVFLLEYLYKVLIGSLTWAFNRVESALIKSFWDFSLWVGIMAIILLATSELLSPYYGRTGILINTRRLRLTALAFGLLFMSTVVIQIYLIIMKL